MASKFGGVAIESGSKFGGVPVDASATSQLSSSQQSLLSPRSRDQLSPIQQQQLLQAREQQLGAVMSPEQVAQTGPSLDVKTQQNLEQFRQSAPKGAVFARDLPEIGEAPELNEFSLDALKRSLAANLITDEVELGKALEQGISGSKLIQDPEGNAVIKMPSGEFAINKPGLSGQDFAQFATRMLSFVPAGRLTGAAKTLAGAVGTETGLQGVEAGLGGEFNNEDVLLEGVGTVAGVGFGKLFNYGKITPRQKQILDELERNPRNPDLAKFTVVKGLPKKTKELKEAVRQFGSPETIAVIKAASPGDKDAVRKMVKIIQGGKKDPLFADRVRVGDVVGDTLRNRIINIKKVLVDAGEQVDNVSRSQLKGKLVDVSQAKESFRRALDDLRVSYNPTTGAVSFDGSALEGAGGGQARDLVKRMAKKLSPSGSKSAIKSGESTGNFLDAADVHFFKRLIDQKTAFGTAEGGLTGEIDRAIKGLRSNLNQTLRDNFPDYAKANQKYADAIGALDKFQEAVGARLNLDSVEGLGVKARSFTNNTAARAKLIDSLSDMQDVLSRNGVRFNDDVLTQVNVANALEERFKTQGSTSLRGEVGKAASDLVTKGVREAVIERGAKAAEGLGGISDEKALESLLKVLGE